MKLQSINYIVPQLSDGKFLGFIHGRNVLFQCRGVLWEGWIDEEQKGEGKIPCVVEVTGRDVHVFPNPFPRDLGTLPEGVQENA